jgi:hypothetical protein
MEILKFENSPRPARKKSSSSKIVLGFASIAAVAMLGSTLAASISLNAGADVEFGQGVAQTTACDDSITLTPISTFNNDADPARFEFTSFTVTGVDDPDCANKLFTVNAYESTGGTVETYTFTWAANGGTPSNGTFDLATGIFNLTVPLDLTSTEANIAKLTLETSNAPTP